MIHEPEATPIRSTRALKAAAPGILGTERIKRNKKRFGLGVALAAGGLATAMAIPNTFTAGTAISSSAVNANFAAIKTAVDALEAKIAGTQSRVTGTCSGTQGVQSVNADGTVSCGGGGGVTRVDATAPITSSGGAQPTIGLTACPARHVLKSTGTGWACAPENSAYKLARLTALSSPTPNATTNMLALTFNAPAAGTALVVGTGYCNVPTSGALSFNISIQTTATGDCSFLCIVGAPCDRSYCGYFAWPSASPQNQITYAVQRELPVVVGANTFYLNFDNTSPATSIGCYAALSATYNAATLP